MTSASPSRTRRAPAVRFTIDVQKEPSGWSVRVLDPSDGQPMHVPGSQDLILPAPRVLGEVSSGGKPYPLPPGGDSRLAGRTYRRETRRRVHECDEPGGIERRRRAVRRLPLQHAARERAVGQDHRGGAEARRDRARADLAGRLAPQPPPLGRDAHRGARRATFGWFPRGRRRTDSRVASPGPAGRLARSSTSVSPKVLVVVGSELSDTRIRAGAEYLGLLRALKYEDKVDHGDKLLNTRLIIGATAADLSRAIRPFKPNVVHVIAHGLSSGGRPVIVFRGEPGEEADDEVDAQGLLLLLRTEEDLALPGLLVLNACAPTGADEASIGRPMAADLVAGGIAIVVGMSGTVADQACRLFTRGFYTSLLSGDEIARAAAMGGAPGSCTATTRPARRSTGRYRRSTWPRRSVPWPSIGMRRTPTSDDSSRRRSSRGARTIRCFADVGRFSPLTAGSCPTVAHRFLAIQVVRSDATKGEQETPQQYGSERLLKELAAEALRDGHVPILVSKRWLNVSDHKWPSNWDAYVRLIWKAVTNTTGALGTMPDHAALRQQAAEFWGFTRHLLPGGSPGDIPEKYRQEFAVGLSDEQKLAKAFVMLDLLEISRRDLRAAQGRWSEPRGEIGPVPGGFARPRLRAGVP